MDRYPGMQHIRRKLELSLQLAGHQTAQALQQDTIRLPEQVLGQELDYSLSRFARQLPMSLYQSGLVNQFSKTHQNIKRSVKVTRQESGPVQRGDSHRVREGDTLSGIAQQHGITLVDLYEVNPGLAQQDPRKLAVGKSLIIPAARPAKLRAEVEIFVPMDEVRMQEMGYNLGMVHRDSAESYGLQYPSGDLGRTDYPPTTWLDPAPYPASAPRRQSYASTPEDDPFGYWLQTFKKYYGAGLDNLSVGLAAFDEIPNKTKHRWAYKFHKQTDWSKPGKIYQGAKSWAKTASKFGKRAGVAGGFLSGGVIFYEATNNKWNAHTFVDFALLAGGVLAVIFLSAPVAAAVGTGIAIYGIVDFVFDVSDKLDVSIGRGTGLWDW